MQNVDRMDIMMLMKMMMLPWSTTDVAADEAVQRSRAPEPHIGE